jgi:hypothetical protein
MLRVKWLPALRHATAYPDVPDDSRRAGPTRVHTRIDEQVQGSAEKAARPSVMDLRLLPRSRQEGQR